MEKNKAPSNDITNYSRGLSMNVKEIIGSIFSIAVKVVLITLAAMFIMKYVKEAYTLGYRVFTEPAVATGDGRIVEFTVGDTSSVYKVGQKLEDVGLVRDAKVFFLQELASENHGKMQPGKYELNTNMTAEEMIKVMARDDSSAQSEDDLLYNEDENIISVDDMLESTVGLEDEEGLLDEGDVSEGAE